MPGSKRCEHCGEAIAPNEPVVAVAVSAPLTLGERAAGPVRAAGELSYHLECWLAEAGPAAA